MIRDYEEWCEHVASARQAWCNEWIAANPMSPEDLREMCGEMSPDEVYELVWLVDSGFMAGARSLVNSLCDEWQTMRAKEALKAHEARMADD